MCVELSQYYGGEEEIYEKMEEEEDDGEVRRMRSFLVFVSDFLFRPRQDTEISLYYAQRVSKPVNLATFSVKHLQKLLLAILGEDYKDTIKATTDKRRLIDSIEASMLNEEERFQMAPKVTSLSSNFSFHFYLEI